MGVRVWRLGFGVWGSVFGVWRLGLGFGFGVWGVRDPGLKVSVWGFRFEV